MAAVTVVGGYRALPPSLTAIIRKANSTKGLRFRTPVRLYSYDTPLERLAQHRQHVAAALRQLIQEEHAVVRQRHFPGLGTWPPPIRPTSEMV